MKGSCGEVEHYEEFHMNALETFILRGKRSNLPKMREIIHHVIDGYIETHEDNHMVMTVFRAL